MRGIAMSRMIASYGARAEPLERLAPVGRLGDVVAFERQRARQRVLDGGLVVDDQYACLLGHDRSRPRGWPAPSRPLASHGKAQLSG